MLSTRKTLLIFNAIELTTQPLHQRRERRLRQVDEVFECWCESGSMPHGWRHDQLENKEESEAVALANFIGGVSQSCEI